MNDFKTIKQLADELGVNKDKVKYQVRKLPSEFTTKKNGITYLNSKAVQKIKELIGGKKEKVITSEIPSDYLVEQLAIKDKEIVEKNNQIKRMMDSNDKLQKLLDQQQILTLQANKKIEELEMKSDEKETEQEEKNVESNRESEKKNSDSFWKKLFRKEK